MDKTNLPPGPYTVGTGQRDARGIYDADHNLLVAATVHTRHFLPYLCTAANAHAALVGLLKASYCPGCDGSGVIARKVSDEVRVTRDMAIDGGDESLEGQVYSEEQWDYEPCQWCDARTAALALAEGVE